MWIIPSRLRPHNLSSLIKACHDTDMSTPAMVMVDNDDPFLTMYTELVLPIDWVLSIGERAGLSEIYNRAYQLAGPCKYYGIICDDVVPETKDWDLALIEAAASDGLAAPSGGHHETIVPHFVLGGDLVREMGWLSLPGLDRLYIDTVWNEIAKARGVFRDVPEAVLSHRHFSNGLAMMDKTYKKYNKELDHTIYDHWKKEYFNEQRS